jgi:hypothetical protein
MTVKLYMLAAAVMWAPAWADSNNASGNDDIYKVGSIEVMRLTTSHILSASTISATTYVNAIPSGLIAAFASASCPAGWSEYTAARGRFLRGIDSSGSTTVDPSGTRVAGATQEDEFKSHSHNLSGLGFSPAGYPTGGTGVIALTYGNAIAAPNITNLAGNKTSINDGAGAIWPSGGAETRPKNVAVLFCQKN